jgi:hemolysin activation/secretion protein
VPNVTYQYKNFDEDIFPTKGMLFHVKASAIDDLGGANLTGILNSKVSFYNSLLNSRKLVLKTAAQTQLNFGDRPEFYQLATLGGDNGLRGYRHQRFSGDRSFSASSDVAYQFNKIKTAFFPIDLSAYVGVDLGRVWIEGDNSKNWHNSYGGGVLLQWTQMIHAGFSAFKSEEGTRISFSTGLRL